MFYLGACLALGTVDSFVLLAQRLVAIRTLVGKVFGLGGSLFEYFFLIGIGAITVQTCLLTVQQIAQLLAVVIVGCSDAGTVHQARGAFYALCHHPPITSVLHRAWTCSVFP